MASASIPVVDQGPSFDPNFGTVAQQDVAAGISPVSFIPSDTTAPADPEALQASAGTDTGSGTNTGLLSVLQTAIATAGALGSIAIAGPRKVQPGAGAPNPARPSILATGTAGTIQSVLFIAAFVLLGIAAFKAFEKKRH